jgi:endonuclease/exonuclease/phosphatase (EEP) superfamily protein YafD
MFSLFWPVKLAVGIFKFFLNLLVFLTFLLTVMALLGDKGWIWSLTTHFRLQYLVIQLVAMCFALLGYWKRARSKAPIGFESWLSLAVLTFFAGLNLVVIMPYYLPATQAAKTPETKGRLKLLHSNLFGMINHDTDRVIQAIQESDPDIVDLVEYTEPWQAKLESSGVFRKYPYHFAGRSHIGLYSKIPLSNARMVFTSATRKVTNQANIIAQIRIGGEPVTLLVAHPASPVLPSHLQMLQNSFRVWEKERPHWGRNLIIVGDLNTSPWSVEFKRLTQRTGLRDSQLGLGLQPSWPMLMPAIGLRSTPTLLTDILTIPIDHVLISPQLVVLSRKTGPFVGSDHLPVIIELGINPAHSMQ